VLVWDDGAQLCVKYRLFDGTGEDPEDVVGDGWGLTETHLAVATNEALIPQTKTGNPIPGKFPYGNDELGGVAEDGPYCIDFGDGEGELDVDCGDTVFIAAHAVIEKCVTVQDTLVPVLTWTRSSELDVAVFPGYGAQWTQAQGFTISTPELFVWDGGELGQYFTGYSIREDISWASWICTENPTGKSLTGTDLRRFNAAFEIPAGYNVTGATLGSVNSGYENVIPMNDNIYIFVNEELLFWGGTIEVVDPGTTTFLGMPGRMTQPQNFSAFPETDGWHMDGTFPAIPSGLFNEGSNNLDVFAEEFWTGGGMHELGLTLQVEQTTCESETAWGGGTRFVEQGNWAMYFTYEIQPVLLDTVKVTPFGTGAYQPTPTYSNIVLEEGKDYSLVASGTYRFANWGEYGIADAAWNSRRAANAPGGVAGWYQQATQRLQVWIGGAAVAWQPTDYNSEHIYTLDVIGKGGALMFTIVDDAYSDNSGFITVEIWGCPAP